MSEATTPIATEPAGQRLHGPPLHALTSIIRRDAGYGALRQQIRDRVGDRPVRFSLLEAAKPALLATLHEELARPTILLVSRLRRARQLAEEIADWRHDPGSVLVFPELDALPYERMAPGGELLATRLRAMLALASPTGAGPLTLQRGETKASAPLIVVTARAAIDRLMSADQCRATTWRLRVGETIRPDQVIREWVRAGYEPVSVVEGPGEFARRGGIIDLFPACAVTHGAGATDYATHGSRNSVSAYRIDLWGNQIESIRLLDAASQRSSESVDEILVGPAHEVLPDLPVGAESALAAMRFTKTRPEIRDRIEDESRMLQEGQPFALLEWYRGLLGPASILDYLPSEGLLILDEPGSVASTARGIDRQASELAWELEERGEAPGHLPRPYWEWDELSALVGPTALQRLDLVWDPDALDTSFSPAPSYSGQLAQLIEETRAAAQASPPSLIGKGAGGLGQLVIVSQQSARLTDLFGEAGVSVASDARPHPSPLPLILHGAMGDGWTNAEVGLTLLTDRELFGWAKVRRSGHRLTQAARERFLSDLEVGELVVHVDHGIGRYHGLVRIADRATGVEREYLDIEYGDNGRLRVPAEHADRVNRYVGSGEVLPSLTKLGGGEWQRTKQRIRSAVQRIAKDLVELYARREIAEGVALGPDTQWQMELEASFPFVETPDQLEATREAKEDLERARPMDRLIVGDVGYGKTEVALRCAFKAVAAGKQVAVLVPTTVLAQQHLGTFRDRLSPFPVRVEMLSRFLTDREAREVVQKVKEGSVDIVIGTHRLLQKDIEFKDLGLLIIDEEQRFGVAHKERFKQFRTEVHVLTLSATPIPRTLHLSLVGVRDLSMIQTPPEERLPIRTYVTEHDEGLVRDAILREIDRGGQVFYVANRVHTIGTVAHRLAELVPEARIAVGHGQMGDEELEDTMLSFANGDADVLVCTTIIEAGLDLPNVNTIIVTNAHQFGLSQLYQLRGRVGRASNRAYAYFLYGRDTQLTEIAEKRLRAIFEATELGAGYRIALKDLEIRGAGNLLGVEQHGHISAVGFDLYCRLLGEAVDQLKRLREQSLATDGIADRVISGALVEFHPASISLPITASLPADYIVDESARLNLYQRLASVRDGPSLGDLMSEVEDRFGALPDSSMNLFYLLSLRLAATEAAVEEINVDGADIVVRFRAARVMDANRLKRELGVPVQARANQVRIPLGRGDAWMQILRELVERLPKP
ncbi:MAG: mfd [Chloroflexi bacterium]|nr:mfd [Chloroflexota bacterium]